MNMIKEGENCIKIHNRVELNIYSEDFIYFYYEDRIKTIFTYLCKKKKSF